MSIQNIIDAYNAMLAIFVANATAISKDVVEGIFYWKEKTKDNKNAKRYYICIFILFGISLIGAIRSFIFLYNIDVEFLGSLFTPIILGIIVGVIVFLAVNGFKKWRKSQIKERKRIRLQPIVCGILMLVLIPLFITSLFISKLDLSINTGADGGEILSNNTDTTDYLETKTTPQNTSDNETHIYKTNYPIRNSTYTGWLRSENMQPDGKGKLVYINNDVYDGDWVNGTQTGIGIMEYDNGDVYEGSWLNGMRHGEGVYTWKDGRIYKGSYYENLRSGTGTFYGWEDVTTGWKGTYIGESVNDRFQGKGEFIFDNGDEFKGEFNEDMRWNGIYKPKNEEEYEIKEGKRVQ